MGRFILLVLVLASIQLSRASLRVEGSDADRLAVQQALDEVLHPASADPTHTGRGALFSRARITRQEAAVPATPVADPGDGPVQPASTSEAGAARYKPAWSNEDNSFIEPEAVAEPQHATAQQYKSNTPIYIAKLAYDEPEAAADHVDLSAAAAASDPADMNWGQLDEWMGVNALGSAGEYGAVNGLGAYGYGMALAAGYGEAHSMSHHPATVMVASISKVSVCTTAGPVSLLSAKYLW
jgi:hypothetical protein